MTLKDIAVMANVSTATVSRVLNDKNTTAASDSVKQLILKIADENGYVLSTSKNRAHTSEVPKKFLYCLCARPYNESKDDSFYDQVIDGINEYAIQNNYILKRRIELFELEDGTIDILLAADDHSNKNLIAIGRTNKQTELLLQKSFNTIVYVSLNKMRIKFDDNFDQIYCDGYEVCKDAFSYLYNLQHRNIALIGQKDDIRYKGYIDSLQSYNLPYNKNMFINTNSLTLNGGKIAMQQLLEHKTGVTAVLCISDRIAIGAINACYTNGLKIPNDISIIGINDIEMSAFTKPTLSTIHIPLKTMGMLAAQTLINRINKVHTIPLQISVPYYIQERESSSACLK